MSIKVRILAPRIVSTLQVAGPKLQRLALSVFDLSPAQLCPIPAWCPNLQYLFINLSVWRHGNEVLVADSWLYELAQHCPHMKTLYCFDWTFTAAAVRALLPGCRHLSTLFHLSMPVTAPLVLAYAECNAQLESVDLRGELLGNVDQYEAFFSRLSRVTLDVPFMVRPYAVTAVSYMRSLESVSLSGWDTGMNKVTAAAVARVMRALVTHAPHLDSVYLSGQMVSHPKVATALVELLEKLTVKSFSLHHDSLQSEALPNSVAAALANAEKACCVTVLDVRRYRVTDAQLVAIAQNNPHLRKLELPTSSALRNATLVALAEHCRDLRHLDIGQATLVTETALVQLAQRCRKLTMLRVSDQAMSRATADALGAEDRLWPLRVCLV